MLPVEVEFSSRKRRCLRIAEAFGTLRRAACRLGDSTATCSPSLNDSCVSAVRPSRSHYRLASSLLSGIGGYLRLSAHTFMSLNKGRMNPGHNPTRQNAYGHNPTRPGQMQLERVDLLVAQTVPRLPMFEPKWLRQ